MKKCYGCFENINDDLEICPFCGYVKGSPPEEAIHMDPGTVLAGRYIIGKVIGYGGFGVTYIGWDAKLEQKVAIKEYLPSEFSTRIPGQTKISTFNGTKNEQFSSGLAKFLDEAKRLAKFQSEDGIVKIFDSLAENDTAYIIMEYLEGETLSERLKRDKIIPEKEAIELMIPVMKSLEVVHKEGIIHRDIAPDNVFITKDGRVKLIDFGAARFATTSHSRSLTVVIKPGFSAEEQYRSRSDQGPHTDVYAIAATLYKMITGTTPPDALERRAKMESTKKDILPEPRKINKEISKITENAILNALNVRIEDRTPTIEKLVEDLTADEPVRRIAGKIGRIDLYHLPLWIKILVASLMTGFLVFAALLATGVIKFDSKYKNSAEVPEGYTIIPNIEGMELDKAIVMLKSSDLNYTTGGNVVSDFIDANLIAYQDPWAGKQVPVNTIITLTVSKGTGNVERAVNGISTVPVFIWSEKDDAVMDFTIAGLDPTVELIFDDNVSAGQVIKVTNANGVALNAGDKIAEGSKVIIYVSKGPEGFAMPNVIGYTEIEAKSVLEMAGLNVTIKYVENPDVIEGTVFEQSIRANTRITADTEVEISVAIPKTFTIEFDSKEGSACDPVTRKYGEAFGELPEPTRDYYNFSGWASGGVPIDPAAIVNSNMKLEALWVLKDEWTEWSDWSTTPVSEETENDLVITKVEVVHHDATYMPKYTYSRYSDSYNQGSGPSSGDWNGYYCSIYQEASSTIRFELYEIRDGINVYRDTNGIFEGDWFNEKEEKVMQIAEYDEYRYSTRVK